jgi:RsiW-degrading membrane proteinase PrsW (M82 family)
MNEIHEKYKHRKSIYFSLIAALLVVMIAFRFFASPGEHKASTLEMIAFACLFGIIIAIYRVFRCPKCNVALVLAFSTSWGKLSFCPKCGVELTENSEGYSKKRKTGTDLFS